MRQQSGNRFFLFSAEFCSMSCHHVPPDASCGLPHRHSIAFAESSRIHLLLRRTGVIHVVTAVINRRGDCNMTISTTENETAQSTAAAVEKLEAPKKAHAAARSRHVAASKSNSGKKATPAKKGAKAAKGGKT